MSGQEVPPSFETVQSEGPQEEVMTTLSSTEPNTVQSHRIMGGAGVELRIDETGQRDGRPIVFIHGFSQCRLAWRAQMDSELCDDFRLLTMDLRCVR